MKGIVITTEKEMSVREFSEDRPLHNELGEVVGGWIEHAHPRLLPPPYCMIVNEEGLLLKLPLNLIGSAMYGTATHGYPIVGNIILLKDGCRDGEPDIVGLDDGDIKKLGVFFATTFSWKLRV